MRLSRKYFRSKFSTESEVSILIPTQIEAYIEKIQSTDKERNSVMRYGCVGVHRAGKIIAVKVATVEKSKNEKNVAPSCVAESF